MGGVILMVRDKKHVLLYGRSHIITLRTTEIFVTSGYF